MAFGKTKRQSTYSEKQLEYITIDDFTPGIHDDFWSAGAKGSFPEGAAQRTNTFGCVAGPNGGLLPGPKLIGSYPENVFDTPYGSYPSNDVAVHITAFKNVGSANDYPSVNSQTFYPSGDQTITAFQTDTGAVTNLFQIINVHPLSTAHYIVGTNVNADKYQCNFGTGSYTSTGRAIQYVALIVTSNSAAYSPLELRGLRVGGLFYGVSGGSNFPATNSPLLQYSQQTIAGNIVETFIFSANPNTGVAWTDADIQAFAAGANNVFEVDDTSTRYYQAYLVVLASTTPQSPFTDNAFYIFQWYQISSTQSSLPGQYLQKTKSRLYKYWSNWFSNPPAFTGTYPATTFDLANISSTVLVQPNQLNYGYTSLDVTRANKAAPASPGNPIVASLINPWLDNSTYSALVYPSSATPSTDSTDTLVITGTNAVRLCSHQDRILSVVNSGIQAFGAKTSIGFEEIRATNVNDYSIDSQQDAIFVAENPSNIGAMVSMNASELIVIKNVGGGYVARGDVGTSPTIVRLPGIPSAEINHIPVAVPGGIIYGTKEGVWEFRGGNTATCISDQLDGKFWIPQNTSKYLSAVGSFAYLYPYVFLPNGFIYDLRIKAWWRLTATQPYAWASATSDGFMMLVPSFFTSGQSIADWYDIHQGQTYYSWQSHPMPITQTRLMEIQEFTLIAQAATSAGGSVTITFEGTDQNGQPVIDGPYTFQLPTNIPRGFTQTAHARGYDMTLRIESQSTDRAAPAPRFHRIGIGFTELQPARG